MLAQENTVVDKAVSSAWQLVEDREIRDQMRRREENERFWNSQMRKFKEMEEENARLRAELEELKQLQSNNKK